MKTGPRILLRIGVAICSLPVLYVLAYVILSLLGKYGPMSEASFTHFYVYPRWMPYGTVDPHVPVDNWTAAEPGSGNKWRWRLFEFYFPLWKFDNNHFHTHDDIYIAGRPGADGKWTYTTNTASILARHK